MRTNLDSAKSLCGTIVTTVESLHLVECHLRSPTMLSLVVKRPIRRVFFFFIFTNNNMTRYQQIKGNKRYLIRCSLVCIYLTFIISPSPVQVTIGISSVFTFHGNIYTRPTSDPLYHTTGGLLLA